MIMTNEIIPVETSKGDRRFIIIRCNENMKGNKTYYDQLRKYTNDKNIVKQVYQYF